LSTDTLRSDRAALGISITILGGMCFAIQDAGIVGLGGAAFPTHVKLKIPDGKSVVPAVREALRRSHNEPTLGEATFSYLEKYLRYGAYHRSRQALMDRFEAQLA